MNFEKVKIGLQELCSIVKENFANIKCFELILISLHLLWVEFKLFLYCLFISYFFAWKISNGNRKLFLLFCLIYDSQIKLKEAENEDKIKELSGKICESELVSQNCSNSRDYSGLNKYHSQEVKTQREDIPEDSIASLQEELAASKLREAESNLALKDLRSKVGELNSMWLKHIKTSESNSATPAEMPSTPKKVTFDIYQQKHYV